MIKKNKVFVCNNCKAIIPPAKRTCRNHCPYCFTSMHVDDIIPWDRASLCKSTMKPVKYSYEKDKIRILFVCTRCNHTHRNKTADDDNITFLIDLLSSKSNKTSS